MQNSHGVTRNLPAEPVVVLPHVLNEYFQFQVFDHMIQRNDKLFRGIQQEKVHADETDGTGEVSHDRKDSNIDNVDKELSVWLKKPLEPRIDS